MDWRTTTTLLLELRDFRNEPAWDRFVERFRPALEAFARRLGTPADDAADVVQETLLAFARAYRDGKYDRDSGRLRSWLFGIAYRSILHHTSRASRRRVMVEVDPNLPDERGARDLWDRIWDELMVNQALSRARHEFSNETYRLFELVVLDEKTPEEVAAGLGVPIKKVYNAKHRVLSRLRELRGELDGGE